MEFENGYAKFGGALHIWWGFGAASDVGKPTAIVAWRLFPHRVFDIVLASKFSANPGHCQSSMNTIAMVPIQKGQWDEKMISAQ